MIIEVAEMLHDIKALKKDQEVLVLKRYDISSIAPISEDICTVYADNKLHEVMSSDFKVKATMKYGDTQI